MDVFCFFDNLCYLYLIRLNYDNFFLILNVLCEYYLNVITIINKKKTQNNIYVKYRKRKKVK